ncbi:hypothetical protein, partial [Candidatus Venteria ishoeyi]|uniref:hypothetical protein n=1 Tax=Candidatus Venteria ishoeyi TaxID=1899563 RepID=UPI0015A89327
QQIIKYHKIFQSNINNYIIELQKIKDYDNRLIKVSIQTIQQDKGNNPIVRELLVLFQQHLQQTRYGAVTGIAADVRAVALRPSLFIRN